MVDASDRMLVMEHELFKHLEIEIFVRTSQVRQAAEFVRHVLAVFDDKAAGVPEDIASALISTSSGSDEPYYAPSFITYVEPRERFFALASFLAWSMTALFSARLHWGKHFPLTSVETERVYSHLEELRRLCRKTGPRGVFHNEYTDRVLGFGVEAGNVST